MSFELRGWVLSSAQRRKEGKADLLDLFDLDLEILVLRSVLPVEPKKGVCWSVQRRRNERGEEDEREGELDKLDVSFLCELTTVHLGFRSRSRSRSWKRGGTC